MGLLSTEAQGEVNGCQGSGCDVTVHRDSVLVGHRDQIGPSSIIVLHCVCT